MEATYRIADMLRNTDNRLSFSIEVYPPDRANPKEKRTPDDLYETVEVAKERGASFASVTCGAFGGNRDSTLEIARKIEREYGVKAMPHIVCKALSKKEIDESLREISEAGIVNLMVLRGDPESKGFTRENYDFLHASDLLDYINENGWREKFCIGCAGYPEGHPESDSKEDDIGWLKHKVGRGAEFVITQLFFNNDYFVKFVNRARSQGIDAPIIPGIIVPSSKRQLSVFREKCSVEIPTELETLMETPSDNLHHATIKWTAQRIKHLQELGTSHFHIYTLDDPHGLECLLDELKNL